MSASHVDVADSGHRTSADAEVVTPRIRSVARRSVFWIGAALICALVIVAGALLTNALSNSETELDGESALPQGSKAVLQVLRDQGIQVTVASDIDEASAALGDQTALALYDPNGFLSAGQLNRLADDAASVVLISPGFGQLSELAPGVRSAGWSTEDTLSADCGVPVAERAESISGGGTYDIDDAPAVTGCFQAETGGYALVETDRVTIVGPTTPFQNDTILREGNAALALGVLGTHPELVWYLPTAADVEASGPPSIAELAPNWLLPATSLLVIVAIVAMVWRGRRFGPLVAEDLPVTVRAGETMEGRARLYQRSGARVRAVDALRIGTTGRLASALGLSSHADVAQVADAAASATGMSPAQVRGILVDHLPQNEHDLMLLSDALRELERAVNEAIDPRLPHRR